MGHKGGEVEVVWWYAHLNSCKKGFSAASMVNGSFMVITTTTTTTWSSSIAAISWSGPIAARA